jgi:hypothetical protein
MYASRQAIDVSPLAIVEVELLDTVGGPAVAFETVRMLIAGPQALLGFEEETFFVFFADVVIQILGDSELAVELLGERRN